jgi:D-cysteine desulfhydrase
MSSSTTSTTSSSGRLSRAYPYTPPTWAKDVLANVPRHGRLHLANAPTPVYELTFPSSPDNSNLPSWRRLLKDLDVRLWIKRDDMTGGCELGGNKIRKLEFLLADAIHEGYDSVITIGGEQSNHCRATAAASRMLGLQPHLILRTKRVNQDEEFGTTGNILFDRMVGSSIYMCTPGEYGRVGSVAMVDRLCTHLKETKNLVPYKIPVGGSNGLGSWGYIEGVDELNSQLEDVGVAMDHLVFACGSGGTAAGICLGTALSHGVSAIDSHLTPDKPAPEVHAVGVCDDPEYFYDFVASISDEMGFTGTSNDFVRRYMTAHQGKGLGYASSTPEELEFVSQFAVDTGIVLDPVYSGKALYHFCKTQ